MYTRCPGIEFAEMDREVLLYDPVNVKFCALNSTASFVWGRLAGSCSFDGLLSDVTRAFVVSRETAEPDVRAVLRQLADLQFVKSSDDGQPAATFAAESHLAVEPGAYETPRVRQMDEMEVLSEFQVTSAGISWWNM
jgi:hypothetical protein